METAGTTPTGSSAGRKRIPARERPTAEDEALNLIAREGEARLAAKRAARAEAREIRMKELEKHQKEVEERPEKDFEKGIQTASSLSAAPLASLGGTFSGRGSGDTSISTDTEASVREIKDSSDEVEEKYKKAMVSNAQLDNEKTNFMYQVETLQDALLELEEQLAESKRQFEEKNKDFEREKHAHATLKFQFMELKEALKQKEELLAEIRQLQQKQEGFVSEITDLQETIEWKEKKIGALERQKVFFDSLRSERDDLREEVILLKEQLKQSGTITNLGMATNGEISDCVAAKDGLSNSSKVVSEPSQVFKVSEDCTEGRENEVEMENEILENMGKKEILQNSEHEENTEDTKDQEIILKCLEIKTLPADENVETKKITEAKITSTLKSNSGLDPVKSYSECTKEIVSLEKSYSGELKVEGASPSHILEEKVSDGNINVTHNQNYTADPSIEINQEIHANLEIVSQQENKKKQIDIVVDESEGNSEVFWEALDFINNSHMAISTSPELEDAILMKASTIDLNSEQSKNGVVEGDLNREFLKNEQNSSINAVTKGPKIEMCETNEENEAQSMIVQQEDQRVDFAEEEEEKTLCPTKVTLNEFGEEQEQVKIEEIQSLPSEHDAAVEKQNEEELGANKENVEDMEALNAYLDFEEKNEERPVKDLHAEGAVVDYINQSKCQTYEETEANRDNDSSCNIKSACTAGSLADSDILNKEVAGSHKEVLSAGKQSVDKEGNPVESAVTATTMKGDTEEAGKNCRQLREEIHSIIVPDVGEVVCAEKQKTGFIEQNKPESEEIIAEEYHEALEVGVDACFGELKISEKGDGHSSKDKEKVLKGSLISSGEEVAPEAFVKESESIQQLKEHTFEEVKFVQSDVSVSETTKSQCGQLEEESKLLDEIRSVQIADYTSEQLENPESDVDESQEETQRNKKGKGKSREDYVDIKHYYLTNTLHAHSRRRSVLHAAGASTEVTSMLCGIGITSLGWKPLLPSPVCDIIHCDFRLKRLLDEREFLLQQIKKLKGQLEEKQNSKIEKSHLEDGVLENGPDMHVVDLQRDANRQISDLKFKLGKSEQEITALEQNVFRLEGQVVRYKTAAENAERIEDELKAEKRKLQRELRSALDKTEELEVSNGHLVKRLEKMKANRSALLSQQ
ncbi:PREDICTED: leucine-rich repeat flightless-interacting protein 1 [Thamnophis sirtalis]|uniref:Leucine-rich repeat flightless-interacting protein 1 n=1 Tax=Thamnophis sirtalis TaxID=35019 RepID=A0A6I9XFE9_9SAUR|nr:PREDICTED: leucine-rich repeat flightless-interacting protein 1 [Thamnophis sirtalis]